MAEYIIDTTNGIFDAKTTGELVCCRDCRWCAQSKFGFPICTRWHHETESGGYCAWAERKGGDA